MMSDFENIEVMLGNDNANAIERELSKVNGNSENHCDAESSENYSLEKMTLIKMTSDTSSMKT